MYVIGNIYHWLAETGLNVKMVMQVHDESVFEMAEKGLEAAQEKIVEIMQYSSEIDVPLLVETEVGNSWD